MRDFSPAVQKLLSRDDVSGHYLVKIDRPSGTGTPAVSLRDTTADSDFEVPSIGVFSSDTGLSVIEAPRLSQAVDRETYKIVYIDTERTKRSLFEDGLTGAAAVVYMCLRNTTDSVLFGYPPGAYLTNPEDLIIAYQGVVDTQGYSVDPDNGAIIAVIECSSPMAALGLTRPFYTSKEYMRQISPTDTSFDQIYQGSKGLSLLWGKIPT